jgi:DNA invertase Pin-like site-specific DNA recombinase
MQKINCRHLRTFKDEESGGAYMEGRKGLFQALNFLEKGMIFICYKVSRLTRSLEDFTKILKQIDDKGAQLMTVEDSIDSATTVGKLNMITYIGAAQVEIKIPEKNISKKIKPKEEKERTEIIPYGRSFDKKSGSIKHDRDEEIFIKKITAIRGEINLLTGKIYTYKEIASLANSSSQYPQARNKDGIWRWPTIRRIIKKKENYISNIETISSNYKDIREIEILANKDEKEMKIQIKNKNLEEAENLKKSMLEKREKW